MDQLAKHQGACLSLALGTPWRGPEARRAATALQGLLREAEAEAAERGLDPELTASLLRPAQRLAEDPDLTQGIGPGLAVYVAPGLARAFRLSVEIAPRALFGRRFHVRFLLGSLDEPAFHILAVSLNRARLLAARRTSVEAVDLSGIPTSFEEALGELQYHSELHLHTSSSARLGRRAAIFHGHGDGDEEHFSDDVFRYFRTLSQALRTKLGDGSAPLVLAAVGEHFPLLRRAELPATVLEKGIEGNPDHVSDLDLHRGAWPIVEEWARSAAAADVERFGSLEAHGKAAAAPAEVLSAAAAGRVDTLLTGAEAELWGRFDAASFAAAIHPAREPGDEELINLAVCETVAARGTARELPLDLMPRGEPMAALFRY